VGSAVCFRPIRENVYKNRNLFDNENVKEYVITRYKQVSLHIYSYYMVLCKQTHKHGV